MIIDSDDINTYLTTEDLSVRYGLKPNTIKRWRNRGQGPNYYRVGPFGISPKTPMIRYKLADVLAWEQSNSITPIN